MFTAHIFSRWFPGRSLRLGAVLVVHLVYRFERKLSGFLEILAGSLPADVAGSRASFNDLGRGRNKLCQCVVEPGVRFVSTDALRSS